MDGKTYAITDLHGRLDLWKEVKKILQPNDKVYFLGDAMDRGPDGYALFLELLSDERVVYLKGNHEDMMAKGIEDYVTCSDIYDDFGLWTLSNGGSSTWNSIRTLSDEVLLQIVARLRKLPCETVYVNKKGQTVYMNHAGIPPMFREGKSEWDLIWNRRYYYEKREWKPDFWNEENWNPEWNNSYLVHGHTPIKRDIGILKYSDGHCFNLDIGAVWRNKTVLLDLDTFKPTYITIGE